MTSKSLIEKAIKFQDQLTQKRYARRKTREQRYQAFLRDPPRHLPSLRSLIRWRNIIITVVFCMISVFPVQLFLFPYTIDTPIGNSVLNVTFFISMIVAGFAATLDWAISKRFGNEKSLIQW